MCTSVQPPLWKRNAERIDSPPAPYPQYLLPQYNPIFILALDIILCLLIFTFLRWIVKKWAECFIIFLGCCCFDSFLEQRLLALEARYGRELLGLQSEKQQLQELLERQSRLVGQLQGELGSSTLNSTLLQRQQAVLTDTVQQLLAMVNHCNGKAEGSPPPSPHFSVSNLCCRHDLFQIKQSKYT